MLENQGRIIYDVSLNLFFPLSIPKIVSNPIQLCSCFIQTLRFVQLYSKYLQKGCNQWFTMDTTNFNIGCCIFQSNSLKIQTIICNNATLFLNAIRNLISTFFCRLSDSNSDSSCAFWHMLTLTVF